jgi:hypothetical protein
MADIGVVAARSKHGLAVLLLLEAKEKFPSKTKLLRTCRLLRRFPPFSVGAALFPLWTVLVNGLASFDVWAWFGELLGENIVRPSLTWNGWCLLSRVFPMYMALAGGMGGGVEERRSSSSSSSSIAAAISVMSKIRDGGDGGDDDDIAG